MIAWPAIRWIIEHSPESCTGGHLYSKELQHLLAHALKRQVERYHGPEGSTQRMRFHHSMATPLAAVRPKNDPKHPRISAGYEAPPLSCSILEECQSFLRVQGPTPGNQIQPFSSRNEELRLLKFKRIRRIMLAPVCPVLGSASYFLSCLWGGSFLLDQRSDLGSETKWQCQMKYWESESKSWH